MQRKQSLIRTAPLILILLVLLLGFSWHVFTHFKAEHLQRKVDRDIHFAQAKMLLGTTIVNELLNAARYVDYHLSEQGAQKEIWRAKALSITDEIDSLTAIISDGGTYLKKIPLNVPGKQEALLEISYQPSESQKYNLYALSLRTQIADFKEIISTVGKSQSNELHMLEKKIHSLITRLEENANKLSFDARNELHDLHLKRVDFVAKNSQKALFDAVLIFTIISALICFIFRQTSKVRAELEMTVGDLKETKNELSNKNKIITRFNESLEGKIKQRTQELKDEIDERKKVELQLLETRKFEAIGQLAGGIAHDFNNVLTIISGYGALVKKAVQHDPHIDRDMDTILAASNKAAGLTRQLLAFSRKQVLQPITINLNAFIGESEKLLKRLLRENVAFSISLNEESVKVTADSSQLDQVLINLVVNARDAIGEDSGEIRLAVGLASLPDALIAHFPTQAHRKYGHIVIEDNGPGIPQEIQGKIFDPFFTTKPQGQGTGLGLSTVYGIVKQSNGFIYLESDAGFGSKFHIYLPLAQNENEAIEVRREEILTRRVSGKTILVVDDDEAILSIIEQILEREGHKVISASESLTALALWKKNFQTIDVLISDVGMPEMSGIELAERVIESRENLPVLFISGYGEFHGNETRHLKRHNYFLQKPFSSQALLKKIDIIFSTKGDDDEKDSHRR